MENNTPDKLKTFMYFLVKDACDYSFEEWLEDRDMNLDDYQEIKDWFNALGVDMYL
jgi:hypothetical protein